jgi:hypothetical protein
MNEAEREDRRQEMLRPDKEKLRDWVLKLRFYDAPAMEDPLMIELAQNVMLHLNLLAKSTIKTLEEI